MKTFTNTTRSLPISEAEAKRKGKPKGFSLISDEAPHLLTPQLVSCTSGEEEKRGGAAGQTAPRGDGKLSRG